MHMMNVVTGPFGSVFTRASKGCARLVRTCRF
jgi:hypothetical protein